MGCGCVVTGFRTSTVLGCLAFRVCSKDFASKPFANVLHRTGEGRKG